MTSKANLERIRSLGLHFTLKRLIHIQAREDKQSANSVGQELSVSFQQFTQSSVIPATALLPLLLNTLPCKWIPCLTSLWTFLFPRPSRPPSHSPKLIILADNSRGTFPTKRFISLILKVIAKAVTPLALLRPTGSRGKVPLKFHFSLTLTFFRQLLVKDIRGREIFHFYILT